MAARTNPGFNRHPVENVELGLRVLAKVGGDAGRAAMILASDETIAHPPSRQTLNRWKTRHAQPYHQLLEEERASVDHWAADRARELAIKAQAGSEQLVDRTIERIDEIEPKDLARSAYNLTQVTAEQVKTGRLLEEKPTQVTELRNPTELIRELEGPWGCQEERGSHGRRTRRRDAKSSRAAPRNETPAWLGVDNWS